MQVTHSTPSDPSFSAAGKAAWDAGHTIVGGSITVKDAPYNAVGDGVNNDTATVAAAVTAASALGVSSGGMCRLQFPFGTYLLDNLSVKPNVWYDLGEATLKKRIDGASIPTNSLIRAVETLVAGSYYGTYSNIKITGGYLDPNGKLCPDSLVRLLYVDRLHIEGVTVLDAPSANWTFALGGRNGRVVNNTLLGGTELFEDGIHLLHGQYWEISGNHVESGDDAIALGCTADSYVEADPDPIRYVTGFGNTVKSNKANALRIYTHLGHTGTNWEITDVAFDGLTGTAGTTRNGGVLFDDNNGGVAGTSQHKRISLTGLQLKVGGTSHDDTNPVGVWISSGMDIKISGNVEVTDGAGAANGFRVWQVDNSQDVDLSGLNCGAIQKNGGGSVTDSTRVHYNSSKLIGSAVQAQSMIVLNNATDFRMNDTDLLNVPDGFSGIAPTALCPSSMQIRGGKIAQVGGATTGGGIIGVASSYGYIDIDGIDLTGCSNKLSGSSIAASSANYNIRNVAGASTDVRGQAIITAAATSVVVTHGAAVQTTALGQISVTPETPWRNATKWWISTITGTGFTINCDIVPGANFTFRWIVNSGKKPAS
jgi:hypothetical protein